MNRYRMAQSSLEFTILSVVIVAGLLAMQIYMKRGVQGKIKSDADNIGEQFSFNLLSDSKDTRTRSMMVEVNDGQTVTQTIQPGQQTTAIAGSSTFGDYRSNDNSNNVEGVWDY